MMCVSLYVTVQIKRSTLVPGFDSNAKRGARLIRDFYREV